MTGRIRRGSSPAVGAPWGKMMRRPARTSGWSWGAGRCSEAAARRSRAAAAEVQRRLGCSGEGWARRGGRGVARAHGGAR